MLLIIRQEDVALFYKHVIYITLFIQLLIYYNRNKVILSVGHRSIYNLMFYDNFICDGKRGFSVNLYFPHAWSSLFLNCNRLPALTTLSGRTFQESTSQILRFLHGYAVSQREHSRGILICLYHVTTSSETLC